MPKSLHSSSNGGRDYDAHFINEGLEALRHPGSAAESWQKQSPGPRPTASSPLFLPSSQGPRPGGCPSSAKLDASEPLGLAFTPPPQFPVSPGFSQGPSLRESGVHLRGSLPCSSRQGSHSTQHTCLVLDKSPPPTNPTAYSWLTTGMIPATYRDFF